jgi:hypothetical protein
VPRFQLACRKRQQIRAQAELIEPGEGPFHYQRHPPSPEPCWSITLGKQRPCVPDAQSLPDRSGTPKDFPSYQGKVQGNEFPANTRNRNQTKRSQCFCVCSAMVCGHLGRESR